MQSKQFQAQLFERASQVLELEGADVEYIPDFIAAAPAWKIFETLLTETSWRQERIRIFDKTHDVPRLSCWMGDAGLNYGYSNMTMRPTQWSAVMQKLRCQIQKRAEHQFNCVLLNYYRDGQDSVGWHSDDEVELGRSPVIASLSFGAARDFHLRHKTNRAARHTLKLEHGSLLLMKAATQHNWQHQVPKRVQAEARINVTFRTIRPC